jgi:hypothetical protein
MPPIVFHVVNRKYASLATRVATKENPAEAGSLENR